MDKPKLFMEANRKQATAKPRHSCYRNKNLGRGRPPTPDPLGPVQTQIGNCRWTKPKKVTAIIDMIFRTPALALPTNQPNLDSIYNARSKTPESYL
ncbi:hypothetical protein Bca4012_084716 [Brassica carinata]|uniref:Uncharacterized protein n=1 Tax=Brassica carinata TaxID=52824 RepID=A0A8X7SH82_BRACI|nr:hypothetical protein Bca52824_025995 [Brassica carinata]